MCSNAREVTLLQIDRIEVYPHLALQRAGEVSHLLYRLFDVADAVNGHLKSCFIVLALVLKFTESLLQIGEQIGL